MSLNQSELKTLPRNLRFTGILQVVDCIDYDKPKVILNVENLRDTFISIFPDTIFKEPSFRFFTDTNGTRVIMEIHDLNILYNHIDSMKHMRYLGIKWDEIYLKLKENHIKSNPIVV